MIRHSLSSPALVHSAVLAIGMMSSHHVARAEAFLWTYDAESRSLIGMEQVEEGDYAFHAVCAAPAKVTLGIGADVGVGVCPASMIACSSSFERGTMKLRIVSTAFGVPPSGCE